MKFSTQHNSVKTALFWLNFQDDCTTKYCKKSYGLPRFEFKEFWWISDVAKYPAPRSYHSALLINILYKNALFTFIFPLYLTSFHPPFLLFLSALSLSPIDLLFLSSISDIIL